MRLELYNAAQARWFPGLAEVPIQSEEIMTIFNNTARSLIYTLVSPNGDAQVTIHPGTFQKISRLGPDDVGIIDRRLYLTRKDITNKLIIINSQRPYQPSPGPVGFLDRMIIKYLSGRGMHFYLE